MTTRITDHVRYGEIDREFEHRLRTVPEDEDGPVLMLNLMHYREWADYPDGRTGVTGQQADDLYAPLKILLELGAAVTLFGDVVAQDQPDDLPWDRIAAVTYPTRRSFMDMQDRPDFIERHVHKDAGMALTIIAACHPVGGSVAGARRLRVELLGPEGTAPEPGPGRLVARVEGVAVGDGRTWTTAVFTDLDRDDAPGPLSGGPVTGGVVAALLQELP